MEFTIRPAVAADAAAMTDVHLRTWREAYTGIVPEEVFLTREAQRDRRVLTWIEIVEGRSPFGNERAYVAEVDGRVVGWSTGSDGRDDDSPYPNELDGLYTLAEVHGTGVGQALLEAAVGTEAGAYCWRLDEATRALSFYRKMGFVDDGTQRTFETDGVSLSEQRMVRLPRS